MTTESCPLKWEFDEQGTWTAASQIMDPDMTDEEFPKWCREWCLQWVIYVDESGVFWIDQSDDLLVEEAGSIQSESHRMLEPLLAKIELLEDYLRSQEMLSNGSKVVLLAKEVYCNG